MQNKRGQFYIVTALLIVMVIITLASTTTYAYTKSNPNTIYELGSELNQESIQIIDHGIYTNQNTNQLISDFSNNAFADYFIPKTENIELFLIYGNNLEAKLIKYNTVNKGTISSTMGDIEIKDILIEESTLTPQEGEIEIIIKDKTYPFNLKPGENFFFIISNQRGEELFITKNK
jgi:hypothetical protein